MLAQTVFNWHTLSVFCKFLPLFFFLFVTKVGLSQDVCDADIDDDGITAPTVLIQKAKTNININADEPAPNGAGHFNGLWEYTPPGYNKANTSKRYPVIIHFGGQRTSGDGTLDPTVRNMCRFFLPTEKGLHWRVERNEVPTVTSNGIDYSFIVISPQFTIYTYNVTNPANPIYNFPSANSVDSIIRYVIRNYNVDTSRIYLTGTSTGANMVIEYVGSSLARARKVAAVATGSLCSQIGAFPNSTTVHENIANAGLPFYGLVCKNDAQCSYTITRNWVNAINALDPLNPAVMDSIANCGSSGGHDTWKALYDPARVGVNTGKNVYQWLIQFSANSALPVKMKDYTVRLVNKKVEIKWTTTDENRNASFTIERAGADQRFAAIGTIAGAGTSSAEKHYAYVDENPLPGVSYYRLLQTDEDGKKSYHEVRKVLNDASRNVKLLVSPNPFSSNLSVILNSGKNQKITFVITDMSGRNVSVTSGMYSQGITEVKINTNGLAKGAYFLKAQGEAFSETQRIIKK